MYENFLSTLSNKYIIAVQIPVTFLHIFVPSDLCCVNWSFSILSCLCYQPLTLQHIPALSGNNRLFDNLKLKFAQNTAESL